jgi:polysaccharide export outer membrane protein
MLFFSACSVKEYKLFQEENKDEVFEPQELNITFSSKIVPNDILTIDIYNMNKKSNIMMPDKGVSTLPDNDYVVYPDGSIILPLLKSVHVEGLTIKELSSTLTDKYREFLKSPYVKAKIKNHKIFVLGEVEKRGVVPIDGETISVIEAIAKSGGLTDHAMRSHIRVISEENGKYVMRTLNLNKFSTLNSHSLMLKHNSIVYIEPKSTKAVNVAINDYLPIMQAVSSVLGTFLTIDYLSN